MQRIILYLNDAEHAWVMAQAQEADVTPAAFLRGLIAYAGADKVRRSGVGIVQEAQRMARTGITLDRHSPLAVREYAPGYRPGTRRGYGEADYRRALSEAGSIQGAARLLGVDRTTVREMAALYNIPVRTLGNKPPA